MNQVLIIDDDKDICQLLVQLFNQNSFEAFYAINTDVARNLITYFKFDCLLVDYMMPKENGVEFLQDLKKNKLYIPAIMLTAIDDIDNKINALESACDDYVAKPFNSKELILRTQNLIKRNNVVDYDNSNLIQINDLVFDVKTLNLKIAGLSIALSDQERQILAIFVNNLNKILDKDMILKELNKPITQSNLNSLNVSILRLRKKIEPDLNNPIYIKTIRNKGFILNSR